MRKLLVAVLVVIAIGVLGTYLYFQGKEYTFRFAEAEL